MVIKLFDCLILCLWQIAQQEAQRATYVVDRAKQERQQKIVQAEGEAASAKLVSFESRLDLGTSLRFWDLNWMESHVVVILMSVLHIHGFQGILKSQGKLEKTERVRKSQGILSVLECKNKRQMKNLLKVIKTYSFILIKLISY